MTHRGPFQTRTFCDSVIIYKAGPGEDSYVVSAENKILEPVLLSS